MTIPTPFAIERSTPFPHLYSPAFFTPDLCGRIYDYFEAATNWHLPEGAAPDDGAIMYIEGGLPAPLEFLDSIEIKDVLKSWLATEYDVTFGEKCELIANKMLAGQGVRPHNDFHAAAPSHRIVIFITRDWSWEHGGELWLLKAEGPQICRDGHASYPPLTGDAVTFEISSGSYHAVQLCNHGVRYSLTYSFYPPNAS